MTDKFVVEDSGVREPQGTGAVRDSREGKGRFDLISPFALHRLAVIYEKGAKKYAERNWEKGMKVSRCLDSASRHINNHKIGKRIEDNLAMAAWNLFAAMHMEEVMPDMNDIPNYLDYIKIQKLRQTAQNKE